MKYQVTSETFIYNFISESEEKTSEFLGSMLPRYW